MFFSWNNQNRYLICTKVLAYLAQLILQGRMLPGWNGAWCRRAAAGPVYAYLVR